MKAKAALVVCVLLCPLPLWAQSVPCPEGNLLSGRTARVSGGANNVSRITDGVAVVEGDPWNSKFASILNNEQTELVFDLGETTQIDALYLQGDNNDTMQVSVSDDDASYRQVWKVLTARGQGMRSRAADSLGATGRYLKISQPRGDSAYSISEFQAFCKKPDPWPPSLQRKATTSWWLQKVLDDRDARAKVLFALGGLCVFVALFSSRRRRWLGVVLPALAMVGYASWRWFNAKHTPFFESWGMYIVVAAVLWWLVQMWIERGDGTAFNRTAEVGALVGICFCSVVAFTNFGVFHGSRVPHYWDMYHYYVGPKYFDENRYDTLYECTITADLYDRGPGDMVERKIRDLRTNQLMPLGPVVDGARERCLERFGDQARWDAFRKDARLFRSFMGSTWWKDMVMDHGYNPSPVWNMIGSYVTNIGWEGVPDDRDKHRKRILKFAAVDGVLYLSIFAMIGWAFGLRACALAILIWGVGYPWGYFWTGGSFGRVPWLFMATAGVCLLKKGRPFWAGVALTWSALLRVFPAALVGGIALKVADGLIFRRTLSKTHAKVIAGCTVALIGLVAASLPSAGGFKAYPEFIQNSLKHKSTPLTNHMGLPTLLSYDPKKVGRKTKDPSLDDPWARWKEARKSTIQKRKWLWYAMLIASFALVGYAGRYLEDWAVTAASILFIIGIFELTCYYYNFIVLMAPLFVRRLRYIVATLSVIVIGQALKYIVGWYDEQYQWETLIILMLVVYVLVDVLRIERAKTLATA